MPDETLDQIDLDARQVWVRAFYGFNPEEAGYMGFTRESHREGMMSTMKDGDLVVIYGAVDSLTQTDLRRQALGFLEVSMEECLDRDRSSPEAINWKQEHRFEHRWMFGIMVRRAWRFVNRVHVKSIAPNAYHSKNRFTRTTRAMLMEPEERVRALSHTVRQVNVWGENPVAEASLASLPIGQILKPSRGIPPTFGNRTITTEDGENALYLMAFSGGSHFLLGVSGDHGGQALVKIGRSNDPKRRLTEIKAGFPVGAIHQWSLVQHQAFVDGATAHKLEDELKGIFKRSFRSQGGELGNPPVFNGVHS